MKKLKKSLLVLTMMSTLGGFFASAQTCAGYVQPANEYVQNGGMEYFNNPCSSLNLNNAPYYPVCSWTYPLWQNASSVTASDYYNTCAPIPTTNVQAANSVNGNINRHNFNNGAPPTATTPLSPHSGNGYSGISVCQPTIGSDHREYITFVLTWFRNGLLSFGYDIVDDLQDDYPEFIDLLSIHSIKI